MKTYLVFVHEFVKTLRSRSFLAGLFLVPLVSFITLLVISAIQAKNQADTLPEVSQTQSEKVEVFGIVDHSGVIRFIPEMMSTAVRLFPDLASAKAAVESGEITMLFDIPADYLHSREVEVYRPDFNPIGGIESSGILTSLLNANLLSDDPMLYERIMQPYSLTFRYLSDSPLPEEKSGWAFLVPYIVTFLFYILILTSSSLLLNSLTKEKENRVIEILLTSIKPLQLLTAKITALGLLGLLQTIIWLVSGWLMLQYSGRMALIPASIQLPAGVLAWGVIFFILGYVIYASLMAGIGALVSHLREASQATILLVLPMIIPLMLISALIEKPYSAVSVGLSLFPLTSPVAMMTRLAAAQIPLWQPILAALIQIVTAWLIIRAVAGMFRAQNIMAGREFNLKIYFRALTGRT